MTLYETLEAIKSRPAVKNGEQIVGNLDPDLYKELIAIREMMERYVHMVHSAEQLKIEFTARQHLFALATIKSNERAEGASMQGYHVEIRWQDDKPVLVIFKIEQGGNFFDLLRPPSE